MEPASMVVVPGMQGTAVLRHSANADAKVPAHTSAPAR